MNEQAREIKVNEESKVSEVNTRGPKSTKFAKLRGFKLRTALIALVITSMIMVGPSIVVRLLPISAEKEEIALAIVSTVIISVVIIWLIAKVFKLKLKFKRLSFKEIVKATAIGFTALLINMLSTYLVSLIGPLSNGAEVTSLASIDSKLVLFIFAVIIAPTTEEVLFRAIPYELHKRKRKKTKASLVRYFIIPGIAFSLLHYDPSFTRLALSIRMLNTFGFALLSAYIYRKRENLTYNIAIHSIHNGIIVLLSFIASSM